MSKRNEAGQVIIKKYSNRRLYNTEISTYITLNDLFDMVQKGTDFIVLDANTNEDLTKLALTQIIFEQEAKGYGMMPKSFLKQMIKLYGDKTLDKLMPYYLENVMNYFCNNEERIREMSGEVSDLLNPIKIVEQFTKQNLQFFENTMKMFYGQNNDDTKNNTNNK